MRTFFSIFIYSVFLLMANAADAFDFYGVTVKDKDAPSIYLKYGIYGYSPIITNISKDSPARRAGFAVGDIIVSINGKKIKKTSDIATFATDILDIRVFNGTEWNNLSINRLAIEAEVATRSAEAEKTFRLAEAEKTLRLAEAEAKMAAGKNTKPPPIVYDDAYLAAHYASQPRGTTSKNAKNTRGQHSGTSPSNGKSTLEQLKDANNELIEAINNPVMETVSVRRKSDGVELRKRTVNTAKIKAQDKIAALERVLKAEQLTARINAGGYTGDIQETNIHSQVFANQGNATHKPIEFAPLVNGVPAIPAGGGNYIDSKSGHFLLGTGGGGVIDTKTGKFHP
jgi:hypothetical protein